ncbi:MAG: type II toxin-antitoxin system VapC family toxin [Deltaproteobacteria bacterium]|nr:type II toxin-antitoxin system VapC family toxin [Deltaproteobacteria bacterium]
MIFDSDVLIWFFRGNPKAAALVENEGLRSLSVVSYMEVLRGVRDKRELKTILDLLKRFDFDIVPLSESIGTRAASFIEQFTLKSGLTVADALIAATAVHHGQTLCTANQRHFKIIPTLDVAVFRQ